VVRACYEPTERINHRLDQERRFWDDGQGRLRIICSISGEVRVDLVKSGLTLILYLLFVEYDSMKHPKRQSNQRFNGGLENKGR
jgi:hypothetical protein